MCSVTLAAIVGEAAGGISREIVADIGAFTHIRVDKIIKQPAFNVMRLGNIGSAMALRMR